MFIAQAKVSYAYKKPHVGPLHAAIVNAPISLSSRPLPLSKVLSPPVQNFFGKQIGMVSDPSLITQNLETVIVPTNSMERLDILFNLAKKGKRS